MTDYKNIRGKKVKFLTSDLDNAQGEGQIFYSDTDKEYKTAVASSAWSAGSNMSTGQSGVAGCGIQTAGLSCGGHNGSTANVTTQEYNGSGWATSGNMVAARSSKGATGTQTAAISMGGEPPSSFVTN